jgi:hypothetical protein
MATCRLNGGIVTVKEAAELGVDRHTLQRLARAGILDRRVRGVCSVAACELGLAERDAIATRRVGGVASRQTAAALWGFDRFGYTSDSDDLHVTVSHESRRSTPPGVILHWTRRPLEFVTKSQVAVTKPMKTVLDLASESRVSTGDLKAFINHCVSRRLLTIDGLVRCTTRSAKGLQGSARLRRTLASMSVVESVLEAPCLERHPRSRLAHASYPTRDSLDQPTVRRSCGPSLARTWSA